MTGTAKTITKTAVICDCLQSELGEPGYKNLIILSPDESDFYGEGQLAKALKDKFGGWCSDALPKRGFWGYKTPMVEVLEHIKLVTENVSCISK